MSLHPSLQPAAQLLGTWRGAGRGEYPTIEDFEYVEELTFTDVGKPFLGYSQRTWSPDGMPMHVETGYLRIPSESRMELILAQPTGQTELAEGELRVSSEGCSAELHSQVVNSASAKQVEATIRWLELTGDTLTTRFSMAAVGISMAHHLESVLSRKEALTRSCSSNRLSSGSD
ncbi:FABP family protein [Garicola koreensis]|uniref:Peroxynitrite isomerase n=1 Tax=Garicola koreensis TaxID=1262554 RepID=A0A7W5TSJ2_9MICC|nr:FABP family protein [Garicola koreensis]MBB3666599.1 hypothetical protein [Garicola koreensis]